MADVLFLRLGRPPLIGLKYLIEIPHIANCNAFAGLCIFA